MNEHYDGCWRDPEHHECAVEYVEKLKMWLSGEEANAHGWMKKATELRFELAELRADAGRYRYLRTLWKRDHFATTAQLDGNPASCDAAIDAARGEP